MSNFSASRLSLARRKRGLTQTKLADLCNVSQQYVSSLEQGKEVPTESFVEHLAVTLQFQPTFFYGNEVELIPKDGPSFRARQSMSSQVRDMALATGETAIEIVSPDLNQRFVLPKSQIPDLTGYSPEEAAESLRLEWKLGYEPIKNMVHLLESKGVEVYWLNEDNPSLDAFMFWRDKPYVLLNSSKNAGDRSRFDAAHELGHLVLHRSVEVVDGREIEEEANLFASAFLLPAEQFSQECLDRPNLEHLTALKERWKVSIQAMLMRGRTLGIYSEWQTRQAFQMISALGMRKKEPVPILPEESRLHKMILDSLQESGKGPKEYATLLGLFGDNLLELMPVGKQLLPAGQREVKRGSLRLLAKDKDG